MGTLVCLENAVIDRIKIVSGMTLLDKCVLRLKNLTFHIEAVDPSVRQDIHEQVHQLIPICSQVGISVILLLCSGFRDIQVPIVKPAEDANSLEAMLQIEAAQRLRRYQQAILPHVPSVVLLLDQEGVCTDGTARKQTLGIAIEALIGKRLSEAFPQATDLIESVLADCRKHPAVSLCCEIAIPWLNGSQVRWKARMYRFFETIWCILEPISHPWLFC